MSAPTHIPVGNLYERLCEVVRHREDCAGKGRSEEFCNCDAVSALDDTKIVFDWLERERKAWQANATALYEIAAKLADDVRPGWRERGVTPMTAICEVFTGAVEAVAQETPTRQRQDRNGLGPKDGGSVAESDAPEPQSDAPS